MIQTFKFGDTPSLVVVSGPNGVGKSSIKEALTVSIYGKSAIRKMKDIPNWINKNGYTNIKFLTTSGEIVEIDRGFEPNFSNIKINEVSFNLPDKRKVDEFIEEELVKIPFTVFCNTISLSFDDFKSFVGLSKLDKRKIIDRMFGIDILSDMRVVVKDNITNNKKEYDKIFSLIERNKTLLQNSTDQLIKLKEKIDKKNDENIELLKMKVSAKNETINLIKEEYSSFTKPISESKANLLESQEKVIKINAKISELKNNLKLYENNTCPHCLNDLTTPASLTTKDQITSKVDKLLAVLPKYKESFENVKIKLQDLVNAQSDVNSKFFKNNAELDGIRFELKKLVENVSSEHTESVESIINSIENEISTDTSLMFEKQEVLNLYNTVDSLLSDNGIKKSIIDKIIPTLNNRISKISEQLEFKYDFQFNNEFDPVILYLGMQISPESLSSGQRKKMNLIVLLSFIEIIKMKHNQMNVMFLDEIFASLDKNNIYKVIEILKEYSIKYNMTVFVVSNESLPEEFFDSKIEVEEKNYFSEMKVINLKAAN